jgi:hypothetical protein
MLTPRGLGTLACVCCFCDFFCRMKKLSHGLKKIFVDVSYAAPQGHEIIKVALHREYYPGIIFIFSKGGRISIMSKTDTESNSNEYH